LSFIYSRFTEFIKTYPDKHKQLKALEILIEILAADKAYPRDLIIIPKQCRVQSKVSFTTFSSDSRSSSIYCFL